MAERPPADDGPGGPGAGGAGPGGPGPGLVVVACVAPADLRPEVDPVDGVVRADARRADLTASDAAALEHALRVGEAWRAPVVAVSAGDRAVEPILREALALGVRALRVAWSDPDGDGSPPGGPVGDHRNHRTDATSGAGEPSTPQPIDPAAMAGDPEPLARALAAAIAGLGGRPLVVCGDRSAGRGAGVVPALVAHHLGAAQALGLVSLSPDPDRPVLLGERRLDGGWRERLRIPVPAVCSVEAAGVRLRRADLAGALAADEATVEVVPPPRAGPTPPAPRVRTHPPMPYRPRTRVVPPPVGDVVERLRVLTGVHSHREPPRIVGPVAPAEAADELLAYLRRQGYA